MAEEFTLRCNECGAEPDGALATTCQSCGGLVDAFYSFERVSLRDSDNPYERYYDLLPVRDPALLPPARMTRTIHARNLGKRIGLRGLYLKDETSNPTLSTKDRMAAVALPFLYEAGARHFCTSSTGNSSTSFAQAIGHIPEMSMEVFTAEHFRDRVHFQPSSQVRHHVLRGASFVEAGNYSAAYAMQHGLIAEEGFFNLGRREGLKLPWLEACEQIAAPIDWYVQAISSAMGVYGVYKGAKEAVAVGLGRRVPRLLCVQQMSCRPMVDAWDEDSATIQPHHIVRHPSGIAEAILRGDPTRVYPFIRAIVLESEGTMAAVSEEEILRAQQLVYEEEGLKVCPSASAAVAAVAKLASDGYDLAEGRILVNLTGGIREGVDPGPVDCWYSRNENGWAAERQQGR